MGNSAESNAEWHAPAHRGRFPELSELVLACRHHLLLTLLLGALLSATCGLLAWRGVAALYEAESLVQVRQRPDVVFTPQTSRADDVAFVRAQQELVLAPQVLAAALRDERVQSLSAQIPSPDPVKWLRDALHVETQVGAEVMAISLQHPSPLVSQALCTAVTQAYLREITNRLATDQRRRLEELERAARQADGRLDELWAELNHVASEVGSDNSQSLTIRDEIQLQAYREYARQLRAAQMRGNELQSLLTDEQLRISRAEEAYDSSVEVPLKTHPEVVAIQQQIATLDARIQQVREVAASDDSPKLTPLLEDRQFYVQELETVISRLRPRLQEQSREQHQAQLHSNLGDLRKQIELNESEKQFLRDQMESIDTTIVRTDAKNGVKLEMARHALERQTRLADGLVQALEQFKIECQSQPRIALIDLPALPRRANRGRQLKATGTAAGAGWLVALLTVGFFEWRGQRVRRAEDVLSHSTRPVFGAVAPSRTLWRTNKSAPTTGAQEAAARLLLPGSSAARVPAVMISSAIASEPRHLVALDLARALNQFGRRTLLVDCDADRRALSRYLRADGLPGLLDQRPAQADACRYIVPSTEDGLDFLPCGPEHGASSSAVDPQALGRLLTAARSEYEAIVVSGPATIGSAVTLLLAGQVDQTLFAVFPGRSRWGQLADSEQLALSSGLVVGGSILHAGRGVRSLTLHTNRRRPASSRVKAEAATEENLRTDIAELQQDLTESVTRTVEYPETPAPDREPTA